MKTDADIRRDVESELQWDPSVDDKTIGVIVNNGVVTLTGEVDHFGKIDGRGHCQAGERRPGHRE
jgi:osmotically-inducible protein OsmY